MNFHILQGFRYERHSKTGNFLCLLHINKDQKILFIRNENRLSETDITDIENEVAQSILDCGAGNLTDHYYSSIDPVQMIWKLDCTIDDNRFISEGYYFPEAVMALERCIRGLQ